MTDSLSKCRLLAALSVALGAAACQPDFAELQRGLAAVSSAGAAGAEAEAEAAGSAPAHGGTAAQGGRGGAASATYDASGAASVAHGGSPDEDNAGAGGSITDANAGADSGGQGGSTTLPLTPVASASSEEVGSGNVASNAFDGSSDTKWCASDGSAPQWWQLDLGAMTAFDGFSIEFESPVAYAYQLQISSDGAAFSVALDRSSNSNPNRAQSEPLAAHGRYVRVVFPSLPAADPWPHWACLREFSLTNATPDPNDDRAGVNSDNPDPAP